MSGANPEGASSSQTLDAGQPSQLEALKQVFPQVEDSILLETLKDEGSIVGAVDSLLKSLNSEVESHSLQIQSDEQIARALQGDPRWLAFSRSSLFQSHDWLANQGDMWEGIKLYATGVVDYVSCGITQIADNLNQYMSESQAEEDNEGSSRTESQEPAMSAMQRETKKER